jgi:ABC-type multidrug transport system fused ATPase/permease subunit
VSRASESSGAISIVRALWRLLDARQRRHLLALQVLSIVMALSTVGGVASVLPFFAALSDPGIVRKSALIRSILHILNVGESSIVPVLGVTFAVSVLIANAINLFGLLAINRFSVRVGETLYAELFAEYLRRGYAFHARVGSSVLAGRVQESARVTSGIVQYVLVLIASLVTIAFIAVAVVAIDPWIAIVAMVGLGACYAVLYTVSRRRLSRNGWIEHQLRAERIRTVSESFGAIKDVTLLGVEDFFAARFSRQSRGISRAGSSTFAVWQSPRYILECLTVVCLVTIALYLRSRVAVTGPWVGQLTFVGFSAYRLLPALQQSFTAIVNIRTDRAAFLSIEMDVDRPASLRHDVQVATGEGEWSGRPRHEIRLCDVSFRYAPEMPLALNEVSLVIPAGSIVGFRGANGSGKSTLLDVVSGLLAPHSGHIAVDGTPLGNSNYRLWRSRIAYVTQHVFLLEASLEENIAFGIPSEQIDRKRLQAALRLACLDECVAGFPAGYHERIGQNARSLSGGERQRVAIARALYRDASMLLFDEATSSLDGASENDIGELLNGLRGERTILIVAHRASALRFCDVVYEIAAGKINTSHSLAPPASRQVGHG